MIFFHSTSKRKIICTLIFATRNGRHCYVDVARPHSLTPPTAHAPSVGIRSVDLSPAPAITKKRPLLFAPGFSSLPTVVRGCGVNLKYRFKSPPSHYDRRCFGFSSVDVFASRPFCFRSIQPRTGLSWPTTDCRSARNTRTRFSLSAILSWRTRCRCTSTSASAPG